MTLILAHIDLEELFGGIAEFLRRQADSHELIINRGECIGRTGKVESFQK